MNKQIFFASLLWFCASASLAGQLQDVQFSELPGEQAEIRIRFDEPPVAPQGFTINKPARIVLDFADVENALTKKKFDVGVGNVSSAVVLAAGGRTRLIVNLDSVAPYTTTVEGNDLVLAVGVSGSGNQSLSRADVSSPTAKQVSSAPSVNGASTINNIDFRRGEEGEGKIIISLSNPSVAIDVEEVAKGIELRFSGVDVLSEFERKLDVVDFATPVSFFNVAKEGRDTIVSVETNKDFDYLAYQADREYVISVKPLSKEEIIEKEKAFAYTGERLSLNFQDIQVRSVLQLIADFTDLNLVASDTVSGSITLRLENVPWDQALDIVLKTKGLDKRQAGNVLMVAPAAEIAERERQQIETQKQLEELAPLRTEYIRIRYANASEIFTLFQGQQGQQGQQGGVGPGAGGVAGAQGGGAATGGAAQMSILSARGRAIVDDRTNSIILTDTEDKISNFKELIERVDVPIPQVMIEARIVVANNDFRRELGVRIAGDAVEGRNGKLFEYTGSLDSVYAEDTSITGAFVDSDGDGSADRAHVFPENSLVDLGVFGSAGSIATNLISSNFFVGLELSALEDSGFAEIVSQPKVITGDKQQASIESGQQIPYTTESLSGGTTVQFQDAVLKLDVTPQITPDDRIIMDLLVNQDSVSGLAANGVPIIDVTQLETQVLVNDGETVVLGGIYTTELVDGVTKVPLLGDIPFVGRLFKRTINTDRKREILIFITPKILSNNVSG